MSPKALTPLLNVTDLHKSFGTNKVLRGIDFSVQSGEVLALIGPSGSGKTTALRCLNGLESPDSGVVSFAGGPEVNIKPGRTPKKSEGLGGPPGAARVVGLGATTSAPSTTTAPAFVVFFHSWLRCRS